MCPHDLGGNATKRRVSERPRGAPADDDGVAAGEDDDEPPDARRASPTPLDRRSTSRLGGGPSASPATRVVFVMDAGPASLSEDARLPDRATPARRLEASCALAKALARELAPASCAVIVVSSERKRNAPRASGSARETRTRTSAAARPTLVPPTRDAADTRRAMAALDATLGLVDERGVAKTAPAPPKGAPSLAAALAVAAMSLRSAAKKNDAFSSAGATSSRVVVLLANDADDDAENRDAGGEGEAPKGGGGNGTAATLPGRVDALARLGARVDVLRVDGGGERPRGTAAAAAAASTPSDLARIALANAVTRSGGVFARSALANARSAFARPAVREPSESLRAEANRRRLAEALVAAGVLEGGAGAAFEGSPPPSSPNAPAPSSPPPPPPPASAAGLPAGGCRGQSALAPDPTFAARRLTDAAKERRAFAKQHGNSRRGPDAGGGAYAGVATLRVDVRSPTTSSPSSSVSSPSGGGGGSLSGGVLSATIDADVARRVAETLSTPVATVAAGRLLERTLERGGVTSSIPARREEATDPSRSSNSSNADVASSRVALRNAPRPEGRRSSARGGRGSSLSLDRVSLRPDPRAGRASDGALELWLGADGGLRLRFVSKRRGSGGGGGGDDDVSREVRETLAQVGGERAASLRGTSASSSNDGATARLGRVGHPLRGDASGRAFSLLLGAGAGARRHYFYLTDRDLGDARARLARLAGMLARPPALEDAAGLGAREAASLRAAAPVLLRAFAPARGHPEAAFVAASRERALANLERAGARAPEPKRSRFVETPRPEEATARLRARAAERRTRRAAANEKTTEGRAETAARAKTAAGANGGRPVTGGMTHVARSSDAARPIEAPSIPERKGKGLAQTPREASPSTPRRVTTSNLAALFGTSRGERNVPREGREGRDGEGGDAGRGGA